MIHLHFLIPHELARTAVQSGAWKLVRCERCGLEYVYYMHRVATGTVHGPLGTYVSSDDFLAHHRAVTTLNTLLRTDCDLVPCPSCGWYQAGMVQALRWEIELRGRDPRPWPLGVGGVLAAGSGFVASMAAMHDRAAWQAWVIGAAGVAAVAGLLVLARELYRWLFYRSNYDPNVPGPRPLEWHFAPGVPRAEHERRLAAAYAGPSAPPPLPPPLPRVASPRRLVVPAPTPPRVLADEPRIGL